MPHNTLGKTGLKVSKLSFGKKNHSVNHYLSVESAVNLILCWFQNAWTGLKITTLWIVENFIQTMADLVQNQIAVVCRVNRVLKKLHLTFINRSKC